MIDAQVVPQSPEAQAEFQQVVPRARRYAYYVVISLLVVFTCIQTHLEKLLAATC